MRLLIAIAIGYAVLIGANQVARSGSTELGARPAIESSSPATEDPTGRDDESGYRCGGVPSCQQASQCPAGYCAGGIPACFQGCCSCAS
jgi:hypothetical protein